MTRGSAPPPPGRGRGRDHRHTPLQPPPGPPSVPTTSRNPSVDPTPQTSQASGSSDPSPAYPQPRLHLPRLHVLVGSSEAMMYLPPRSSAANVPVEESTQQSAEDEPIDQHPPSR
ncbi:hypothetical protein Salat_2500400 [Sesamum alatum]|uniref:Uncharacterized protein n=1 Tax=Sesamum alatum TaxID=300844 RepID=A0AAE2CC57_9LAMI|nr:hypothetical protein Salat_2500400 [Sesamum alatum]